jgi:hypothetical protein
MLDISDIRRKSIDLRGLADIRLVRLEDGPGRGQRLLQARTPQGLFLEVAVDRGFDILSLRYRGQNLGWNSAVQHPYPAFPHDLEHGLGFLRNFDGFLATCGLDHHGVGREGSAERFRYPLRETLVHPLHGRIASVPARLNGYGIRWTDRPAIWAEGTIRQAAVFGEVLELQRRIELPLEGDGFTIRDEVVNLGYRPTPHGILYHFNFGYPLLDEGTRLVGDFGDLADALHQAPPVPADDAVEIVHVWQPSGSDGRVRVGLVNPDLDGGLSVTLNYDSAALPKLGLWRCFQSGIYALGIEPLVGPGSSEAPDILEAGEARTYSIEVQVSRPPEA